MYTNMRSAANAYARIGQQSGAAAATEDLPVPQVPVEAGTVTTSRGAASAYANVGLETGVVAASPHQLIVMLYEGAELAVRMAIRHAQENDKAKKAVAVSKACSIITEGLRASLDPQQGGEIAQRLDALYDYMNQRLMLSQVSSDAAPLEEVLGLLQELHGAWKQIAPAASQPQA
ncbi:MAG: flagellar export chaperone FliS [Gammaproteobacteria bacterium]